MKQFKKKFKKAIIRHKAYFEKGMGILSYGKYLVAGLGLVSNSYLDIMILGLTFAILCYIVGFLWITKGFYREEQDFNNRYNPFVKHMLKRHH